MNLKGVKNLIPYVVLFEVVAFSAVFFTVGYIFNREDPLFMKTYFSPTTVVSLVLSLYYGFAGGIPFLLLLSVLSTYIYGRLLIYELLWNLLIVMVAAEFRYYWLRRIRSSELEKEYLNEQIARIRKELFLIKLSHDQLEFNYIVKPYSLRGMIKELRDKLLRERKEKVLVRYFLSILSQNFHIYRASLYSYSDGEFRYVAGIGGSEGKLNREDPLVKVAVESEETHYLPPKALKRLNLNGGGFNYLAVVFASAEEEKYLLVIEDMLFVNLNEEILTYIYILLQYMLEDIVFARKVSPFYTDRENKCAFEFIREFYKMYELNKKVGIQSSLVVFRYENLRDDIRYEIEHAGRSLDMVCFVDDKKLILYLLPFTAPVNAKSFVDRMRDRFKEIEFVAMYEIEEPILEQLLRRVKA